MPRLPKTAVAVAFCCCWGFLATSRGTAAEILILGDSWGVGIKNSLANVAAAEGFTVDGRAHGGRTAANMATASGLGEITTDLNANPDAKVVHLIIGGNDFLNQSSSTD